MLRLQQAMLLLLGVVVLLASLDFMMEMESAVHRGELRKVYVSHGNGYGNGWGWWTGVWAGQ
jgi:hypothetical protein